MKQFFTSIGTVFAIALLAGSASAAVPTHQPLDFVPPTHAKTTLNAQDALGMMAQCYGGYGGGYGAYDYGYAPVVVRRPVRSGVSINVGRGGFGYGGYPGVYRSGYRGYGGGFGPGVYRGGRGFSRGGVGLYLNF